MLKSISLTYTRLAGRAGADDGQALLEYALILGLVSIVCVAALTLLGTGVSSLLGPVAGAL